MGTALDGFAQPDASFVSTERPTRSQRTAALTVAVLSGLVFLLTAPFAKVPLEPHTAFLPLYQSALVVFDLITSVLLFGQYRMLRTRALLFLAAGYAFNAVMATAHALSFPGLFAPAGLIGAGPQTTAWLYFLWHAGFALFILAYAMSDIAKPSWPAVPEGAVIAGTLAFALICAAVPIVLATAYHDLLPPIMTGNSDAPGKLLVALATWLVGIVALAMLWRRRPLTVLDLWLMVVLCVWIADTALAAVLNHGRFDVGWYAGRVYALLANGFVLAVLLLESGSLYARLARSNRLLGEALSETRRLNGDLQAFAGSLAHDLQQPLTTITSFAQVIQAGNLPERESAHMRKIVGAAEAARGMIKALLDFARLGDSPLRMTWVDLDEIVARSRAMVHPDIEARSIEWNIQHLPVVQGDASLLSLAMTNLLSNAVKYTRNRERAVISVEAEALPAGGHVIRIRDNGVGFDMGQAGRLFTPFERLHSQREFEGTGMGLANVRRIIERHGGSIMAQSQPGQGAVFSLVLHDDGAPARATPLDLAAT